ITGNHFADTPISAIQLSKQVSRFTISGNEIQNAYWTGTGTNGQAAITIASSNGNLVTEGTVSGNTISGNPANMGLGIWANGTGLQNIVIAENEIQGAALSPVRITSGTGT